MKKLQPALVLCCAAVMAFTACAANAPSDQSQSQFTGGASSQPAAEKVTLTVSHDYTKEEAEAGDITRKGPRDAILKYAEDNKDTVTLDITEIQHNDYETKMQALAAANDLPDVFQVKGSWINNFVENGLLADLTDAYNSCAFKDEYRDYLFDPATVDGKIYCAPMQFSSTALVFYNLDLWKQAGYDTLPATWQEMLAANGTFESMGLDEFSFGNKDKWQINSSWISAIADRYTGTDWTNSIIAKDGKSKFTDPAFVSALSLIRDIGASGALNPDYSAITHQQAAAQFIQGKSATFIDGYWGISYLTSNADADFLSKVVIAPHPGVEGGLGDAGAITAGCGWFLGVNSQLEGAAKEAAEGLVFAASGPVLSQAMSDAGYISTCNTTPSDLSALTQLNLDYMNLVDNASSTIHIYDARIDAAVIDVMNENLAQLLAGSTTPEDAAQAIQAEYETLLN